MDNLLAIINKSADYLLSKGIQDAKYEAECLIAFGLNKKRLELYLEFDRPLNEAELSKLRQLIVQRGKRIPLQHIIGQVGFRYIELKTDARALIPRPDTESIVDLALEKLKGKSDISVLEIGVGTGAILLSLSNELELKQAIGCDISEDALVLAKENSLLNNDEKVEWIHSDLFENIKGQFDLIISNPPYIPSKDIQNLETEVKDHDPLLALDGGLDGYDIVKRILAQASEFLKDQGYVIIEVGFDQGANLKNLDLPHSLEFVENGSDYNGIPRFGIWKKKS